MKKILIPYCYKCKTQENLVKANQWNSHICRECEKIKRHKYNTSPLGRQKCKEYVQRYKLLHPLEWREQERLSQLRYRKTPNGAEKVNKATNKWRLNNKEKRKAADKVTYAIQTGKIIKPDHCEVCMKPIPSRILYGHHEDYSKPLIVVWLCRLCHYNKHHEIKSL